MKLELFFFNIIFDTCVYNKSDIVKGKFSIVTGTIKR